MGWREGVCVYVCTHVRWSLSSHSIVVRHRVHPCIGLIDIGSTGNTHDTGVRNRTPE